ncbi:hypothetical protein KC345_g193 [Hortaea werneckii]|nr:hypothetical protein KC345_g193 [Hortaea werneckii]
MSLCLHLMRRFRHASHATRFGPRTEVLGVLIYCPGLPAIIKADGGRSDGGGAGAGEGATPFVATAAATF